MVMLCSTVVDCGDPGTPTNGGRQLSSTTFRAAVQHSCDDGFDLEGSEVRICQASGKWTGFLPTCKSKQYNTFS